ncbi:MAG: tetratricopeptide repeat protein [bacterium]|nr:tetratricopeptide repeat protein [bacterium]
MGPIQQYQGIIQSCGKLLEFYPKSKWIDDALMVMGISYYRLQDFPRAERKFTELVTIFPKSRHAEMASIWRARSLVAQSKLDLAEQVLANEESKFTSPGVKAASYRTRAEISEASNQPSEAVTFLEQIRNISYDRAEKATDSLRLGRSYTALSRNDDARSALNRCLDLTRSTDEAFQARKMLADLAASENKYVDAKAQLIPMRTDRRFSEMLGKIDIELGRVEARIGDPETAIRMLEHFCASATQGEDKAIAYFMQGEVARDRLAQFVLAKAKFDSVAGAGASRALQDSARQAAAQVQSGLSALERIPALKDSLQLLLDNWPQFEEPLEQRNDSSDSTEYTPQSGSLDTVSANTQIATVESPDSSAVMTVDSSTTDLAVDSTVAAQVDITEDVAPQMDTLAAAPENESMAGSTDSVSAAVDSNFIAVVDDAGSDGVERELSPAEMIADSIMRELARQDSIKRAERAHQDSLRMASVVDSVAPPSNEASVPKGPTEAEQYLERVRSMSRRLVSTHLEAASFFDLVARNMDSTLVHLEAALAVPDSSDEHWRAYAQLGMVLIEQDADAERGRALLQDVAGADAAPRALRNTTRQKLGLEELPPIETEQSAALRRAEQTLLSGSSIEEVITSYQETAQIDSVSLEGCRSLHAIAFLQEFKMRDYDAARSTHEALARLFPDSSFAQVSRTKVAEPDTNSIFLLSDAVLESTYQPASELLSAESDSTGWPPEIETLRGRRFR